MARLIVYDKESQFNVHKPVYIDDCVDVECATLITGTKPEEHDVPIINFMAPGKPYYAQARFTYEQIEILIKKLQGLIDTKGYWVNKTGGK